MYPGILWGTAPFQQTPLFVAPLTNSLNATKGTNVFTFAVATSFGNNGGFVSDWENNLRRCKPQEARFTGARRVENLINGHSENLTNPSWLKYNAGAGSAAAVVTANYTTSPLWWLHRFPCAVEHGHRYGKWCLSIISSYHQS